MDRANIIHDLLDWIETHLDQPLLLDNVAAKSGYSKWHLQRMFRSTTGHALGSYIRERRLSKAAQALRSTPRPILDIALQFHFDSQPSFSRAFKKQFGKTPAVYRRTTRWDVVDAQPLQAKPLQEHHHESPGLQLLFANKCVDGKCNSWMGQH
ncbi:helix-turn-helix domain-containing protein [Serratia odorifera]|uniref:Transcriptional regulator, AraC family n=2 Tax=Serratia odorifera TaxID=618 RepID=D4E8X0_SEROD|nr:helix-turn-helix domain-containing protein [Serratia odorifera]EFE93736.1 transcriptional regulator, AraC family [Serratia odorifera DSM 4582]MBJ2064092.1 helix-turn-helix domain-containing protein [Serratia odorifera]PNK88646.1 AraC family transcriptional regulator [Serratia odorifera]RII69559.1 AraC family transcriptional regulator [Serratia odorifera]VDZ65286.1 Right origin-binding protein [Serratia odorifera]